VSAHQTRSHVVHSASVAERFWNCPGSVRLIATLDEGEHEQSSSAANRGTAVHELIEHCLLTATDAHKHVGAIFNRFVIDDEMADGAQVHLDVVRQYMGPEWTYFIETKVSLEKFGPPVPMSGTADFIAYNAFTRHLVVVDYKNGVVFVDIAGNKQTRYYALGSYLGLPVGVVIETIEMVIVQPNALTGEAIKREIINFADLIDWGFELIDRARATLVPNAAVRPGDWCKWCPARGVCPARAQKQIEEAQLEFDVIVDPMVTLESISNHAATTCAATLPILTPEQLGRIYLATPAIKAFLADVAEAIERLQAEQIEIPGLKRVFTQGDRAWSKGIPETEIISFLNNTLGLTGSQIYTKPKVISAPQAEKAFVTLKRSEGVPPGLAKTQFAEATAGLVVRPTGTNIVSTFDARQAIPAPGDEFEVLSAD
jgi:hypothetical protein